MVAPCRHARLMALNALFCAGSTTSTGPDPLMLPAGGTIADDAGSVLNPTPGTLSNGAASVFNAASYVVGFTFGSGSGPISFIFARTSSGSGDAIETRRTPICNGSDQPSASYGRSGGAPGYWRRSG